MVEKQTEHSYICGLVIQGSYELRRALEIDDSSYTVDVSSAKDPRKYYLHNVLTEVDKANFAVMFANSFLTDNQNAPPPIQADKQLNSKILQVKIDELSMWRRKLVEILIDLIGFRRVNNKNYYRHYNCLHELAKKRKENNDRTDFWGCKNKALEGEIQLLEQSAEQQAIQLDPIKCWYANKEKKTQKIKSTLTNEKECFTRILLIANKREKALLLSYRNSFGKPSELLHPARIIDGSDVDLNDFSYAIQGVCVLSLHVISTVKDLLRMHNVKGVLKKIANALKKNTFPVFLFSHRTSPKIAKGDFVNTPLGLAQVKKVLKNEFKYKTLRVRFLKVQPSKIDIEEYLADEIQLIVPYKVIKQEVVRILTGVNPDLKLNSRRINKAIKNRMLELCSLLENRSP
jgi:hypothetical protein